MDSLKENLEVIEQKFRKRYEERKGGMILDGITDYDEYVSCPEKILWVMKAPHDDYGASWDLREFHKNLDREYEYWKRTYKLIIKVSYAIINGVYEYAQIPDVENIKDIMKKIAFINIKKSGDPSRSDPKIIKKFFNMDKDLILEQIRCIKPEIIINCSKVNELPELIGMGAPYPKSPQNIFYAGPFEGGIIINAYHPNASMKHDQYFNNIIDYIKEYKGLN